MKNFFSTLTLSLTIAINTNAQNFLISCKENPTAQSLLDLIETKRYNKLNELTDEEICSIAFKHDEVGKMLYSFIKNMREEELYYYPIISDFIEEYPIWLKNPSKIKKHEDPKPALSINNYQNNFLEALEENPRAMQLLEAIKIILKKPEITNQEIYDIALQNAEIANELFEIIHAASWADTFNHEIMDSFHDFFVNLKNTAKDEEDSRNEMNTQQEEAHLAILSEYQKSL